jgi:hypothetical protein
VLLVLVLLAAGVARGWWSAGVGVAVGDAVHPYERAVGVEARFDPLPELAVAVVEVWVPLSAPLRSLVSARAWSRAARSARRSVGSRS